MDVGEEVRVIDTMPTRLFVISGTHAVLPEPLGFADEPRLLVRQLASGAKDEQIARTLGLSLRTVRRRVADLMIELGVDTRFQAGAEAVRRGWL